MRDAGFARGDNGEQVALQLADGAAVKNTVGDAGSGMITDVFGQGSILPPERVRFGVKRVR